jgi:hypothetical protein
MCEKVYNVRLNVNGSASIYIYSMTLVFWQVVLWIIFVTGLSKFAQFLWRAINTLYNSNTFNMAIQHFAGKNLKIFLKKNLPNSNPVSVQKSEQQEYVKLCDLFFVFHCW